jgi:hypothetical protein
VYGSASGSHVIEPVTQRSEVIGIQSDFNGHIVGNQIDCLPHQVAYNRWIQGYLTLYQMPGDCQGQGIQVPLEITS